MLAAQSSTQRSSITRFLQPLVGEISGKLCGMTNILKAWHFPGECDVFFDKNAADFVIDGKPRERNKLNHCTKSRCIGNTMGSRDWRECQ